MNSMQPRIKPPALKPGDVVGIIAPASNIKRDALEAGCQSLRTLGYEPIYLDSIFEQDLYFAGSAERRARELEGMFEDESVRAIICARGGYGTNYLLPLLDLEKIKRHPKIFVGYSDVTTLLTFFFDAARMITFHGPMVTKDFAVADGVDEQSWRAALGGGDRWIVDGASEPVLKPLVEGMAEGTIYGGCLSMLVASLGTPYEIKTADTILFIEDVAAKPYQIDRMLMHLRFGGKFAGVKGIIFGEMVDCVQHKDQPYTLEEVVHRIVGDLGIPVAYGLRSGHVSRRNITLPIGVRARLNVGQKVTLEFLETATVAASEQAGKS